MSMYDIRNRYYRTTNQYATVHMFGMYINGKPHRFEGEYSEAEFQRLTRFGLPDHWIAWHYQGPEHWKIVHSMPVATPDVHPAFTLQLYQITHNPEGYGLCRKCKCRGAHGLWKGQRWVESKQGRRYLVPIKQPFCLDCAIDLECYNGKPGSWN